MTLSVFDAARECPEREALVCQGQRFTFSALAERVASRCQQLEAWAVHPLSDRPVALVVDGSLAMFEFWYALFALGVPVLPLHPRLTALEREILCRTGASALTIDPSEIGSGRALSDLPAGLPAISHARPLVLVPSSGTSGAPKLVELTRAAFHALARASAERVPWRSSDRALLCLPLSHVGGLSVLTRCLLARRPLVAFQAPPGGLLRAAPELARVIDRERISLLSLVPPVLSRLLREVPHFGAQTPLRAVLLGGQACTPELFQEAVARAIPMLSSYGLTETCSQVSSLALPPPAQVPVRNGVVSSGFPLSGVELRVRNGLIEVRGPTLFKGYVGRPSALDSEGFFHTGDRGELDPEQGLFVFGRQSELIITGGENIDPSEVEHALSASGMVEAACVFGVPDLEFGQRVAAALEPARGISFDEPTLFAALDQRLASFKQPRSLCLFTELPRLSSGKLDRSRIVREAQERLHMSQRSTSIA